MDDVSQVGRENVVGAVLVVGGGISGMQASLDLAEAGYKVHMVETKSAIGGHMAQLDKTFPTNDCAMCTISPRLVDTGRHLDVDILTDSEVTGLDGEAGNFTATIRTRPRYIDVDICNGCGECAEVCPVPVSNPFNKGLGTRQAAYKLYPQATPDAFAIDKAGVAPCRDACPAGQRAQGYISLINAGQYAEALRSIKADNPFPAICGRICNAPCEDACTRGKVDEPVAIRALKRFVTDTVYAEPRVAPGPVPRKYAERIAVIGAGPCGLTAAQDLCMAGYGVTVFESLPVAGGMLRVGVPEYRLAADIIDREIQDILDLGVELRLNTPVESLDDLFADGFDAVLIAVGAHEGVRLGIPGSDLDGVLINTRFLRDVRLSEHGGVDGGEPVTNPRSHVDGKRVVVVGGGDVAIDVARTAVRLGAASVDMAVRGSSGRMPATDQEIRGADEEGIAMHVGLNFMRVVDDGTGRVAGLECQRVARFETDADGRRQAIIEDGSEHVMPADVLIFSVGQKAGLAFIPDDAGVGIDASRTIAVAPNTYATDRAGVFAAGDSVSGTAFVIDAVAGGHDCAGAIERFLRGKEMDPGAQPKPPLAEIEQVELDARLDRGEIAPTPRVPMPEIDLEQRLQGFGEIETGYDEAEARAEAARCLDCGICSECLRCSDICGVGCIDHNMVEKTRTIDVGAVVLAPGYQTFQAELSEEYGYGRYDNVVTSLQYERLLSVSGPTEGHVQRPSDGATPKKIAFLQCVGSRDQKHDYCSSVCCMYAAKQSIMSIEHEPDTEVRVFMMDMRSFSKGYEAYYQRAQDKYGIGYTRCRVSSLKEDPKTRNVVVRYAERAADGDGHAAVIEEEFDMVVLSVGMEISENVRALGRKLGVELDDYGFCQTVQFDPLQTSRPGIYAVGPFREPKDIPDSLVEASGAAAVIGGLLAPARGTLTREAVFPEERDVTDEDAKIAVFVCHCGNNISGFLDVTEVTEYAKSLPGVIHAQEDVYACSQDSIAQIAETVKDVGANRVVVASCTPLTHEALFQSCVRSAGLNPFLMDMANIRNQCSWVHSGGWDEATAKAKDLVRMSAARTGLLDALPTFDMPVEKGALVVGGGAAGMTAALTLADQGFPVHLVERSDALGGNLRHLHFGIEEMGAGSRLPRDAATGLVDPQTFLADLVSRVEAAPLVTVHLATELKSIGGIMGNFMATLQPLADGSQPIEVRHGAAILATGGSEYRGDEYGYGTDPGIVTQQQFEATLAERDDAGLPASVVMIQCVGPAERYCGRICCTSALKNALVLKQRRPDARVTVIYKDIRTYGFKERLYTAAREAGVVFVHYEDDRAPMVDTAGDGVEVRVWEEILGREMTLRPDMLVLSTPVVPDAGAPELSTKLKVPIDMEGFFMEAHAKLRPMDFLSEGIFMAGMAHYPKLLEESIIHAQAAAARAATLLSKETVRAGGRVAAVDVGACVGCLTCVRACSYGAVSIGGDIAGIGDIIGAAQVEAALCQGCGLCAAACPAGAIDLMHYTSNQVMSKVDALFDAAARQAETVP